MIFENILSVNANGILTLTINREDKLNALNKKTIAELSVAFKNAAINDEVKVIILTGAGTKAFVAGADIAEFADFEIEQGRTLSAAGQHTLFDVIENLPKPVIAAVNGFALGGGLELAMSCHLRVASSNAKMGLPEVSLGVIPGYGGTQRLPQLVGKGKAFEMIMTAEMMTAQDAFRYNLVNHVVEQNELIAKCEEIAGKIISKSPVAIAGAIRAINAGYNYSLNGYEVEIDEFGKCFGTDDFHEGTTAFLEKRNAIFPGK
ncbi:MAG: enoyl-CoA hydratase/isomerase family protein [Bacteroidetes bacterium]|nr:enoyl-CoA hydratase/isomerase family protein [Bacteroidota bacterium]HET6245388.1 enoyl-CoA hydratase-related protein [Bacteroidia bacterium]